MFLWCGCSDLEFDETNNLLEKEDVYKYFNRTTSMLNHLYSFIPQDFGKINLAMLACSTDDAEFANAYSNVQDFNNGSWSALNTIDDKWRAFYTGIRAANSFIVEIETVDFSRYKYDQGYSLMMKKLPYYIYQARLLRAYYFFELARRYGDIPMPLKVLTAEEANTINKTKFAEVINFVVNECEEVAPNLPVTYKELSQEYGRVTKGFAMALKTKALLYMASEMHNPTSNADKWKQTAQAAYNLIDSAEIRGWYQLEGIFTALNNYESKENILSRQNWNSNRFEMINFPVRLTDGKSRNTGVCPSQNLVDAFETINGYSVTLKANGWDCTDPEFDKNDPYNKRDPRFSKTVIADGMTFKGIEIESYKGGREGGSVAQGGTATGYFLRKYIQETTDFDPNKLVINLHTWVIYRYAEALLTYAESMIEAFGDPDYTDGTYTRSARWALNQVRQNAGMPEVTLSEKSEFLAKVRNEWRVEFAFEDHRFWDIRRWQIGSETQTELYGVGIEKLDDGTKQYQKELYESRFWSDKMYLYPISQSEIFTNSNLQPQNPGW